MDNQDLTYAWAKEVGNAWKTMDAAEEILLDSLLHEHDPTILSHVKTYIEAARTLREFESPRDNEKIKSIITSYLANTRTAADNSARATLRDVCAVLASNQWPDIDAIKHRHDATAASAKHNHSSRGHPALQPVS